MPGARRQSRLFRILQAVPLMLVAGALMAQGAKGYRYPIVEADVAKELSAFGVNVNVSQIHFPVKMSAAIESPKLEIVAAEPVSDSQARLELSCTTVSECLPFFSTVDIKNARLVSSEMRLKIGGTVAESRRTAVQIGAARISERRLKAGSHVALLIREGHLNIRLQVVAMDSGAVGQQVRVCTLDRRKVFHGTVMDEETVAGVME